MDDPLAWIAVIVSSMTGIISGMTIAVLTGKRRTAVGSAMFLSGLYFIVIYTALLRLAHT